MFRFREVERIRGWCSIAEGDLLYRLARSVDPTLAIVEIGSYQGKSTCYLALGSEGAPVFAVDLWSLHRRVPRYRTAGRHFRRNVKRVGVADRIVPIRGFSVEVGKSWKGPEIGLLYIDGCHSTPAVIADFKAWQKHLAAGAVVAFHDYHMKRVRRAIRVLGLGPGERTDRIWWTVVQ